MPRLGARSIALTAAAVSERHFRSECYRARNLRLRGRSTQATERVALHQRTRLPGSDVNDTPVHVALLLVVLAAVISFLAPFLLALPLPLSGIRPGPFTRSS